MKLDLGCGNNKRAGFIGIDSKPFDAVDVIADLTEPWKWENDSVDEVHCSHFIEHLTAPQRILFVNELYRVLKPEAKATIIFPHAFSERAYGDLTHQWPPMTVFWFYYLSKDWRATNAPHNDFYTCDFTVTWGYSSTPDITVRSAEYQQFAYQYYKEAIQDVIATFAKR